MIYTLGIPNERKPPTSELIKHNPDFNDLAWTTMQHLWPVGLSPGRDDTIMKMFRLLTYGMPIVGTVYVNPAYTIRTDVPSREFIQQAKRAQLDWLQRLRTSLFSWRRVKNAMKRAPPIIRQLAFTGMLFVNGKHVLPNRWPTFPEEHSARDLIKQTFGRLIVQAMLPKGRCECLCTCGNRTVVRRKHLLAGRTKSCGCLKTEHDTRPRQRRQERAWVYTGHLA